MTTIMHDTTLTLGIPTESPAISSKFQSSRGHQSSADSTSRLPYARMRHRRSECSCRSVRHHQQQTYLQDTFTRAYRLSDLYLYSSQLAFQHRMRIIKLSAGSLLYGWMRFHKLATRPTIVPNIICEHSHPTTATVHKIRTRRV